MQRTRVAVVALSIAVAGTLAACDPDDARLHVATSFEDVICHPQRGICNGELLITVTNNGGSATDGAPVLDVTPLTGTATLPLIGNRCLDPLDADGGSCSARLLLEQPIEQLFRGYAPFKGVVVAEAGDATTFRAYVSPFPAEYVPLPSA